VGTSISVVRLTGSELEPVSIVAGPDGTREDPIRTVVGSNGTLVVSVGSGVELIGNQLGLRVVDPEREQRDPFICSTVYTTVAR
jgi:hypothetical protein